ncbi:MAG: ATP-grasp domain-containing protein [Pseudomonadota bacterium]
MKTSYPSVLVLGVVPSLTWQVARCLKRAGGAPAILAWHALSPMKLSPDCRRYISWSKVHKTGAMLDLSALDQVRDTCRRRAIDIVVAADYDTALLLAQCPPGSGIPRAAVPDAATIATFNNKWTLSCLLEHIGLPYPDSAYVASEAALLNTALTFPIITKPLDKWASVGFEIHPTRAALARTVARGRLQSGYPLIAQSHVPGDDVGASFLASHGRLAAYSMFQHKRRGERVFFEDRRLLAYLETFIDATGYHGVGHIDTRYDPLRDHYRILELNPRFWASLLYAANAGLNYPDLLVRLDQWDRASVSRAHARKVSLPPYERVMALTNRWFSIGYEKVTRAKL